MPGLVPFASVLHSVVMEWMPIALVAAMLAVFFALKKAGSVSEDVARDHLAGGARVIDVRSPEEFQSRHLPGALNIPLDRLKEEIGHHAPDKRQVLLLHCLSGGRSGLGRRALRDLGYTQVFNLGSYGRAERIVCGTKK
jgi:phage shock protein E